MLKQARMKRSFRMGQFLAHIERQHGLDFTVPGTYIKLDGRGAYMDLSIGCYTANQVSISHYYRDQSGDMVADPDVVFLLRSDGQWYPIEITQPTMHIAGIGTMGGYQRLAEIDDKGGIRFNQRRQADVAMFANEWAVNLGRQGFREAEALEIQRPEENGGDN